MLRLGFGVLVQSVPSANSEIALELLCAAGTWKMPLDHILAPHILGSLLDATKTIKPSRQTDQFMGCIPTGTVARVTRKSPIPVLLTRRLTVEGSVIRLACGQSKS